MRPTATGFHWPDETLVNEDIATVVDKVPAHDLLVGGFPCQDYSVAKTASQARGLEGIKGVLWWSIYDILERRRPKHVFLENVDRLLKSPTSHRGRDFAIILSCLNGLGYMVEWRVVNAAEYGFPQRRKRVFIVATKMPSRTCVDPTPRSSTRACWRERCPCGRSKTWTSASTFLTSSWRRRRR